MTKQFLKTDLSGDCCSVSVWGREYRVCGSLLLSSVVSLGEELLCAPIAVTASENGKPITWQDVTVIPAAEEPDCARICVSAQSDAFIVNTCMTFEEDGFVTADLKLMPKGFTVPQLFGLEKAEPPRTDLDYLYVDVPVKREAASLYHFYPNNVMPDDTGSTEHSEMYSGAGFVPDGTFSNPFASVMFLGNDRKGIFCYAASDRGWQPSDPSRAIELITDGEKTVLRLHLLDSFPRAWQEIYTERGQYTYPDLSFRLSFQASPVREFPADPYTEKRLHIDCFKKIASDYDDFLRNPVVDGTEEIGYDRIKRLGVTTLILHEKWNQIQNYWKLTATTARRVKEIISECHRRGIKVVLYFGYEISTLSDIWYDKAELYKRKADEDKTGLFWYRFPAQREHPVCYASPIADEFAAGLEKLVDELDFDGVYLDGTGMVWECKNTAHGCGYTDADGVLHATYPIYAVRKLMKRIYDIFDSRGKTVNCHVSDCICPAVIGYCHGLWLGEYIQYGLVKQGAKEMPAGYLRATHSGRNIGIPAEFIVYENKPIWTFDDAFAFSLLHGILPRPNDIGAPLEKISEIWRAIDAFPVAQSEWCPYFSGGLPFAASDDRVKISGYRYTASGEEKYLLFVANSTADGVERCALSGLDGYRVTRCAGGEFSAEKPFGRFESEILLAEKR